MTWTRSSCVPALTIAAVLGPTTVVHGQSSVTLYGIVDEGFSYNSNVQGHSQYAVAAQQLNADRWGLTGAEDLGGGLNAVFALENGFNLNTGGLLQGGALFGRRAFVGLSNRLGVLTFGRQWDAITDTVGAYILASGQHSNAGGQLAGISGAHPGDLDNLDGSYRLNNSVKYVSPVFGGFKVVGLYSFGGVAGDFTRNQVVSVAGSYNSGPVSVGIAFDNIKDPNFSYYGNTPASS